MMAAPRTRPPAEVRRQLRREVGFGCPVNECGSPYLTWHHFDPPWHESAHHEPHGTIALCLDHHKRADAGAFTQEQLRRLKDDPYPRRAGMGLAGTFSWRREQLIVCAGGNFAFACDVVLKFRDRNAIWLSEDDEGNQLLNLDLWGRDGSMLLSMRDNDWVAVPDVEDLECPPSGRSLIVRIPSQDVRLELKFAALNEAGLREYFRRSAVEDAEAAVSETIAAERAGELIAAVRRYTSTDEFVLCEITGHLVAPVEISLTPTRLVLPNIVLSGSSLSGSGVGIQIV